jgi:hypothetical protein
MNNTSLPDGDGVLKKSCSMWDYVLTVFNWNALNVAGKTTLWLKIARVWKGRQSRAMSRTQNWNDFWWQRASSRARSQWTVSVLSVLWLRAQTHARSHMKKWRRACWQARRHLTARRAVYPKKSVCLRWRRAVMLTRRLHNRQFLSMTIHEKPTHILSSFDLEWLSETERWENTHW